MATPYSDVYNAFIFKVEAYKLISMLEENREKILNRYLESVCRKVQRKCAEYIDLSNRDNDLQEFTIDIDEDMIEILAECMVAEWLKPKIYSDELLESRLNTKDFTEFSPAKLIEHTRYVYEMSVDTANAMINNYTFSHRDIHKINEKK